MPTSRSRRQARVLLAFAAVVLCGQLGCATIVSEKRYPVTIDNTHGATFFSVHDRKNKVIHQGMTPQQVTLDAKSYPFWPAKYTVVYAGTESTTQSREVKAGFDPWFAGNLILGGAAGAIIDGATGAMFKLPERVEGDVPAQFAVNDPQLGAQLAANSFPSIQATDVPATNTPTEKSAIADNSGPRSPAVRMASTAQQ